MNSKKILALTLAVLMMFLTFAGCRKVNGDNSALSSVNSDITINYSNVDIVENESESEPQSVIENTTSEVESIPTTSTDSETTQTIIPEEPVVDSGEGSIDNPYEGYLSENGSFLTHDIPAGQSKFYNIRGVGGKIVTVNSSNVYIVFNDKKYTAENGVLSFTIESDAKPNEFLLLEFGNSGTAGESFSVVFSSEVGTIDAPENISSISNSIKRHLEDNDSDGYVYQYTAEKEGIIKFYLLSGTEKGQLMVSNKRNSATRSTESLEEGEVKTDDVGTYVELEVKKDDDIIITIGIKPDPIKNKYKATDIEFLLKY